MTVVDPDLRVVQRADRTIDIWWSVLLGHSHPSLISSRDDISESWDRSAEWSGPIWCGRQQSSGERGRSERLGGHSAFGKYREWERRKA
jgi:hypothetical protein